MTRTVITIVAFLIAASISAAEMHQWVDANGRTHYGDTPPVNQPTLEIKGEISSYTKPSVESLPDEFFASLQKKPNRKRVVMYSAEWCGVCRRAKSYFKENKISFQEMDIDKSKRAQSEYAKLKAKGIPVILIGKQRMNGFSETGFNKLYNSNLN